MSDKQAAVIYQRVTRSVNGFAIMKKQHLSSFVAGQGTLSRCRYFFVVFLFFCSEICQVNNYKRRALYLLTVKSGTL